MLPWKDICWSHARTKNLNSYWYIVIPFLSAVPSLLQWIVLYHIYKNISQKCNYLSPLVNPFKNVTPWKLHIFGNIIHPSIIYIQVASFFAMYLKSVCSITGPIPGLSNDWSRSPLLVSQYLYISSYYQILEKYR